MWFAAGPASLLLFGAACTLAQAPTPKDTEQWTPVPAVVTPGATSAAAPSDAIVLFDGKGLDQWVSAKDKSPAKWTVADGALTVSKQAGNIEPRRSFRNYQLHLEWRVPENVTGSGQGRGNSGVFPQATARSRPQHA